MEFNFPKKEGTGITKLIPQVQVEVQEVIVKLLVYNSDNRMSAGQALKHPAFKELREADKTFQDGPVNPQTSSQMSGMMRMTHRGAESMSQNSKSMTKISDNMSEGSYPQDSKKPIIVDKYKTTKGQSTDINAGLGGLKIDTSKNQTFNSELDDSVALNILN